MFFRFIECNVFGVYLESKMNLVEWNELKVVKWNWIVKICGFEFKFKR